MFAPLSPLAICGTQCWNVRRDWLLLRRGAHATIIAYYLHRTRNLWMARTWAPFLIQTSSNLESILVQGSSFETHLNPRR